VKTILRWSFILSAILWGSLPARSDQGRAKALNHATFRKGEDDTPYRDSHMLQFRWEVFNVTNSQPFGPLVYGNIGQDPFENQPPSTFGRFGGSQTPVGESRPGRVMQFGLRYSF